MNDQAMKACNGELKKYRYKKSRTVKVLLCCEV